MTKCDFCKDSIPNGNGGFSCPFSYCIMPQYQIDNILKSISKIKIINKR